MENAKKDAEESKVENTTQESSEAVQPEAELPNESKATDDLEDNTNTAADQPVEDAQVNTGNEVKDEADSEKELPEAEIEKAADHETTTVAEEASNNEAEQDSEDQQEEEEEDHHDEDPYANEDFSTYAKDKLLQTIAELSRLDKLKYAERVAREVKAAFDKKHAEDKAEALEKFVADGGEQADFEYRGDLDAEKVEEYFKLIRERKVRHFQELEKQKDENLKKKQDLLEQLREIVDGEENTASINTIKKLQQEWRSIGPVPGAFNKTLWANYNAILDRYYDNRSIYFELKELDRKKNHEAKLELCEKAEALDKEENIKEAVKHLNELHDEFKHIGPIPKEVQEEVWQRFKAASDKIYAKRKEYVDVLKKELKENMDKKLALGDEVASFLDFKSEKISDWNKKTKEILDIQKRWEAIGGIPREHARDVNKKFWSSFKGFFANKNRFFKSLESKREENLKLKEELVAKAEALKDSTEWIKTADELKKLQQEWKDVGPVPEKARNEIYKQFKAACDHFFDQKRAQHKSADKEFEKNLKEKEAICDKLEKIAKGKEVDIDEVYDLQDQYAEIGFVPRNAIKKIQERYDKALSKVLDQTKDLDEEEKLAFKANLEVNKIKSGPNADRKLNRKEHGIRKKIATLEMDVKTWKTNMGFFASSAKADKLKDQFEDKIKAAEEEIELLKEELRIIQDS